MIYCAEAVWRWSAGSLVCANSCPGRGGEGRRLRVCGGGLCGAMWKAERREMIETLGKRRRGVWTEGSSRMGRPPGFLA